MDLDTSRRAGRIIVAVRREDREVVEPAQRAAGGSEKASQILKLLGALGERVQEIEERVQDLRKQFDLTLAAVQESLEYSLVAQPETTEPESSERRVSQHEGGMPSSAHVERDQEIHQDALRYARLLVSEIELYNQAEVTQGRERRDLYSRLQAQIDRSRRAYHSRFSRSMIQQPDYFHEELVRSLARNDAATLGPGYPWPSER